MRPETLYRCATWVATPFIDGLLRRRARLGKEELVRLGERWGIAAKARPAGDLVWLHAASVGESLSLLPILARLLEERPDMSALVTSGTVTSARLLAERLPARAIHQYLPVDHPRAVARFIDHWQPSLAIWVESELWPNLISHCRRRGVRLALLNARLSAKSFRNWRFFARAARRLLSGFTLIAAQDEAQADRFALLSGHAVETLGDLKSAGAPSPPSDTTLAPFRSALMGRPAWLAASTHPGEEFMIAAAHRLLRREFPQLVTLLAPRHPARADAVLADLAGLSVARRSLGELPSATAEIWLIDTLGEMALFQSLVPLVLVAGSLGPPGSVGGHNPLEPASFGCALMHGADTANCAASTARLDAAGAALLVQTPEEIAGTVGRLLGDSAALAAMQQASLRVVEEERAVLDRVMARLRPLLAEAPVHAGA